MLFALANDRIASTYRSTLAYGDPVTMFEVSNTTMTELTLMKGQIEIGADTREGIPCQKARMCTMVCEQ